MFVDRNDEDGIEWTVMTDGLVEVPVVVEEAERTFPYLTAENTADLMVDSSAVPLAIVVVVEYDVAEDVVDGDDDAVVAVN